MRRPSYLFWWVIGLGALLIAGQYAVLAWAVPRYLLRVIERTTGGDLIIERAHLAFPFTTTLTGIRMAQNTEEAGVSIQRIVIRPRWISLASRTLWIDVLDVEDPLVRITRTRAGAILWPLPPKPFESAAPLGMIPWRVRIASINLTGGVLEFVDRQPDHPFHGALDHMSVSLGPVVLPPREALSMSFAIRSRLTGAQGSSSPAFCSGWTDLAERDLQASCHLAPLPLAAFESYFSGRTQLRAYTTTLKSSSSWIAKSNELTGRMQFELGNLTEGDFSVRGRTVVDVKQLGSMRLTGAVTFNGPLNRPEEWDAEFTAGDPVVQFLVERLSEYDVRLIKVPAGKHTLYIRIAPLATEEAMTDIEAVSREVQDALELLAAPLVVEDVPLIEPEASPSPVEAPVPPPIPDPAQIAAPAPAVQPPPH